MRSLYKNPNTNDIEFRMIDGQEQLCQNVRETLTTVTNEWVFNPSHGFRRYEVLGKKYDQQLVTDELIAAVLQENGVASVDYVEWVFDREQRKLSGKFAFRDIRGQLIEGRF